jgi:hypothetical protein
MAKTVTIYSDQIELSSDRPNEPTKKQLVIRDLMTRPDGATSVEIQKATKENKRRSHYSLSRLAARFGFEYAAFNYTHDDGTSDLLHHFMLPRNGGGKRAAAASVKRAGKKSG